jgi:hypothetical protein
LNFQSSAKNNGRILALDQKLKINQNDINKTFDLVKTCEIIWSNEKIKKFIIKTFDLVTKSAFDQTPNLTETFDQVKRSSEIWSSDQLPLVSCHLFSYIFAIIIQQN